MITFDNYQDKKSTIDWKSMPKNISDTRDDVESFMEFYNDDADIKETVDLFIEGINKSTKPVNNIIVAKLPKIDFVDPKKKGIAYLIANTSMQFLSKKNFPDNPNTTYFWDKEISEYTIMANSEEGAITYGRNEDDFYEVMKIDLETQHISEIKSQKPKGSIQEKAKISNLAQFKNYLKDNIDKALYLDSTYINRATTEKKYEERIIKSVGSTSVAFARNNTVKKSEYSHLQFGKASEWTFTNSAATYTNDYAVLIYYYGKPENWKVTPRKGEDDNIRERMLEAEKKRDQQKETLQDAFLDAKLTRSIMPKLQQMAVLENDESEEVQYFIDKIKEFERVFVAAAKQQDDIILMEKPVVAHFFYGKTDWYIIDFQPKENTFFGYVILNGDVQMSEAGYISIAELHTIKGVELDFNWKQKELGKALEDRYPDEFGDGKPEAVKKKASNYGVKSKFESGKTLVKQAAEALKPKTKVAKVIDKTIVDNLSPEFLLIRRFWNLIKKETISVPFRTVQLLYMAFNKAAVERKVRKTSESAELFTKCNKKIITLFEDFPNLDKKPFEIEFTDKGLYNQIQAYVSDVAVNPAIPVLKRFIALQNTKPEIKKAETLLKAINKIFDQDKENRLFDEIKLAKISLSDYVSGRDNKVDLTFYGLSRPVTRSVCTNRIKCSGIDKTGKLHKGYKFQEHTGNIIKVRKGKLASPNVCENRVKCTGLSKTGKLLPGYKFQEGTNHVIKVRKNAKKPAKKPALKKKVVAGLGLVFNQGIERIYVDPSPIIPIVQGKAQEDYDYSTIDPRGVQEQSVQAAQSVVKEKVNVTANRNSLAYRREKNKNVTHEYYAIENPDVSEFLGQIEKKKKESVAITIAGGQGSGKTSFVFQLMNAFAKNYKVGHASIEEHPESALYENKAERFWDDKAKATVDSPEINSMKDIHDLIMRNDVIVIDSFSKLLSMDNKITLDDTFRKKYDGKLFVVIYQLTTDGKMRGGSSSQFDGDVILFVEKSANFNDNYVYADKNRYQNRSLDELHYNIATAKLMRNELEPVLAFTEEVERI